MLEELVYFGRAEDYRTFVGNAASRESAVERQPDRRTEVSRGRRSSTMPITQLHGDKRFRLLAGWRR